MSLSMAVFLAGVARHHRIDLLLRKGLQREILGGGQIRRRHRVDQAKQVRKSCRGRGCGELALQRGVKRGGDLGLKLRAGLELSRTVPVRLVVDSCIDDWIGTVVVLRSGTSKSFASHLTSASYDSGSFVNERNNLMRPDGTTNTGAGDNPPAATPSTTSVIASPAADSFCPSGASKTLFTIEANGYADPMLLAAPKA